MENKNNFMYNITRTASVTTRFCNIPQSLLQRNRGPCACCKRLCRASLSSLNVKCITNGEACSHPRARPRGPLVSTASTPRYCRPAAAAAAAAAAGRRSLAGPRRRGGGGGGGGGTGASSGGGHWPPSRAANGNDLVSRGTLCHPRSLEDSPHPQRV